MLQPPNTTPPLHNNPGYDHCIFLLIAQKITNMFAKSIILSALVASASAFNSPLNSFSMPSFNKNPKSAVKPKGNGLPDFWNEKVGVTAPAGFFDPLQLSKDQDAATLVKFREAELKHGRIAMMATLGFLVSEVWHPMLASTINLDAIYAWQEMERYEEAPLVMIVILIAAAEGAVASKKWQNVDLTSKGSYEATKDGLFKMQSDTVPGDYNWDPLNLLPEDSEGRLERMNQELNHGRLAMLAIAGFVVQEKITSQGIIESLITGAANPFN